MMKGTFAFAVVVAVAVLTTLSFGAWGDDVASSKPNFHRDVLPIPQENCQPCHRSTGNNMGGRIAPMSVRTVARKSAAYTRGAPWKLPLDSTLPSGMTTGLSMAERNSFEAT